MFLIRIAIFEKSKKDKMFPRGSTVLEDHKIVITIIVSREWKKIQTKKLQAIF